MESYYQIIRDNLGELLFIYLGVPFNTKRLFIGQYESLLERMLDSTSSWTEGTCFM